MDWTGRDCRRFSGAYPPHACVAHNQSVTRVLGLLLGGDLTTTSRGQVEDVFTDEVQTSIEDSRGGRVGQRLRIYLSQTQIHRAT